MTDEEKMQKILKFLTNEPLIDTRGKSIDYWVPGTDKDVIKMRLKCIEAYLNALVALRVDEANKNENND